MMRKHLIYLLGAILAYVISGCTKEEIDARDDIELTIELTIASNMQTRTPRPLESVDYWQHVSDVRVYVFHSDKANGEFTLYTRELMNEDGTSTQKGYIDVTAFQKTDVYKNTEFETHSLYLKLQLPTGYYRFLAIGVDEERDTHVFNKLSLQECTKWDEVLLTEGILPTTEKYDSEVIDPGTPITNEFFSGISETIQVSPSITHDFINIELKRCVAGVLLYVKNIPSTDKAGNKINSIKLILSGYNQTTDIVNRSWKEGQSAIPNEKVLAEFSSANAIKDAKSSEYGHYYTGVFLLPSNTGKLKGDEPTLKLLFYNGNSLVKEKKLKIISAYDTDFDYDKLGVNEDGLKYNLLANHVYCLGLRSENIKDPIDLTQELNNSDDEVKIKIYGSWQADIDITL